MRIASLSALAVFVSAQVALAEYIWVSERCETNSSQCYEFDLTKEQYLQGLEDWIGPYRLTDLSDQIEFGRVLMYVPDRVSSGNGIEFNVMHQDCVVEGGKYFCTANIQSPQTVTGTLRSSVEFFETVYRDTGILPRDFSETTILPPKTLWATKFR